MVVIYIRPQNETAPLSIIYFVQTWRTILWSLVWCWFPLSTVSYFVSALVINVKLLHQTYIPQHSLTVHWGAITTCFVALLCGCTSMSGWYVPRAYWFFLLGYRSRHLSWKYEAQVTCPLYYIKDTNFDVQQLFNIISSKQGFKLSISVRWRILESLFSIYVSGNM